MAALAAVSACSSVPTSGPVEYHTPQASQVATSVRVAPLPPAADADQSLIVEGFLHAMSVYQPGYAIARLYLTQEASLTWNPDAGVTVYEEGYPPQPSGDSVVLTAPLKGTVDAEGAYHVAAGQVKQDFGLVKDANGQWRISTPPEGLLVSRYLFTTSYLSVNLHYLDNDGRMLVADPVWLASGDDQLLRALRRQLRQPGDWLAPLVRPQPEVRVVSVAALGDSVQVELDAAALALTPDARKELLGEFVYTSRQFVAEPSVSVSVNGAQWRVGDGSGPQYGLDDFPQWSTQLADSNVYGVGADSLVSVDTIVEDGQKTAVAASPPGTLLAVDAQRRRAAVVGADRKTVSTISLAGPAAPVEVLAGSALLRPEYSSTGELWIGRQAVFTGLTVVGEDGSHKAKVMWPQSAAALADGKLTAFRLAPDGDRLAVALQTPNGPALGLMRVMRGDETTLEGWQGVDLSWAGPPTAVLDVGWSDESELTVLVTGQDSTTDVLRVSQDLAETSIIGPESITGLVELAVYPGNPIFARSDTGGVYRYSAESNWSLWTTGLDSIVYPR
ncbi:MAG: LpqB family beta-propeller domain-containing protein [Propionibacteriaceae bacterium]|jgi:hypothetical protein|nr:LpqB family beta-propeller domain-containing protein [Propionibacteriaceae bacterium]